MAGDYSRLAEVRRSSRERVPHVVRQESAPEDEHPFVAQRRERPASPPEAPERRRRVLRLVILRWKSLESSASLRSARKSSGCSWGGASPWPTMRAPSSTRHHRGASALRAPRKIAQCARRFTTSGSASAWTSELTASSRGRSRSNRRSCCPTSYPRNPATSRPCRIRERPSAFPCPR